MARFAPRQLLLRTGENVEIRNVFPEDADLFIEFQQQGAGETQFTMQLKDDVPNVEQIREKWKKELDDEVSLRLGAFINNKLVGLMGVHSVWPKHPWVAHLLNFGMLLHQAYWGTGLSEEMMKCCFIHAKTIGAKRIEATVRSQNPRGVGFYKKMGFEFEGTRRMAAIIDGVEHDEFYIAKLI